MKLFITSAIIFFTLFSQVFLSPTSALAASCEKSQLGQCINGKICSETRDDATNEIIYVLGQPCGGSAVVGGITPPVAINRYNSVAGGIGIILFASSLLRLATIIAGIWVMFNFVFAGWIYVSSNGDAAAHTKVAEKITFSVIGILLIVVAYTIAGILSLLFFGDAGFILNPTLTTIQTVNP